MTNYEITVQLDNGDWQWRREHHATFHQACLAGLDFAYQKRATLIRIEVVPD